jgi:hypothetical protein
MTKRIKRLRGFISNQLPDGGLGASGRPDPKRLCEGGMLYRLFKAGN